MDRTVQRGQRVSKERMEETVETEQTGNRVPKATWYHCIFLYFYVHSLSDIC